MSIGSRIKERREELGITQVQLAEMLGVTKGAVGNYETGANSPKASLMFKVFEVLQCDANYIFQDEMKELETNDFTVLEIKMVKKYRLLDLYGKEAVDSVLEAEYKRYKDVQEQLARQQTEESEEIGAESVLYVVPRYSSPMSAGTGQMAGQERPENEYLIKEPPRGTSYIAPVRGDSMEPTYHDGELLFIHATPEIRPGQIGVFLMDGKQWIKELGKGELISHNPAPEYSPIPMTENIQCQGLVIGLCDDSYLGNNE